MEKRSPAGTVIAKLIDITVVVVCIWVLTLNDIPGVLRVLAWVGAVSMSLIMFVFLVYGTAALQAKEVKK